MPLHYISYIMGGGRGGKTSCNIYFFFYFFEGFPEIGIMNKHSFIFRSIEAHNQYYNFNLTLVLETFNI